MIETIFFFYLTIFISWQIIAIDTDKEAYEVGLPMIEKAGVAHKIKFIQSDAISVLDKLMDKKVPLQSE